MTGLNTRGASAMRHLNRYGIPQVKLAQAFNVHPSTVSRAVGYIGMRPLPPNPDKLTDREAAAVRALKSAYPKLTLAQLQSIFALPSKSQISIALRG